MSQECYDCGDPAEFSDLQLPGDMRCVECHLTYLQGEAETWIEEIQYHIEDNNITFDFKDLLP